MITSEDIDKLKRVLPQYCDNYVGAIVTRTNLTYPTVNKFFNNDASNPVRHENAQKIYKTSIEIILEIKSKEDSLRKALDEATA